MNESSSSDEYESWDDSNSESEASLTYEEEIQKIRENDPSWTFLDHVDDNDRYIQNMTNEEWEELGRDIANNTHLEKVDLSNGSLNDHKMSSLFRGLTRSSSIKTMILKGNELSLAGVRSMVPFSQNANSLRELNLNDNNLQSEGFNVLFRALRDSPIEELLCCNCGIQSIEIDTRHIPRHLTRLVLHGNIINADGCRGLAKLLQGGDTTLDLLSLDNNKIDDDGMEILVEALKNNVSLQTLYLRGNSGISKRGMIMMLKLVNDVSSIEAALRSNHTLGCRYMFGGYGQIQDHINGAFYINRNTNSPEAAGREKVIQTQLHSERRAELAELQGVNHSVYSEIDPLNFPEVLALVGRRHGHGELYLALKSLIVVLYPL